MQQQRQSTWPATLLCLLTIIAALFMPLGHRVAAQGTNQLRLDTANATPSTTGTVAVYLENSTAVATGQISFSYDATVGLTLTGATAEARLNGYTVTFAQDADNLSNVQVTILFYDVTGKKQVAPGSGALLKLDYSTTTDAGGNSPLRFDRAQTVLVGEGTSTPQLPFNTTDGAVTIVAGNLPAITSVAPASGQPGETVSVTITGANSHFTAQQSTVDFGADINVNRVTINSATELSAEIEIAADATTGSRTVTVATAGDSSTETLTKADAFTVFSTAPTPTLTTITPAQAERGQAVTVTVLGEQTNFVIGRTDADFGAGITVDDVAIVSPTEVVIQLTVATDAEPGERTVTLTTGSETAIKEQGFRVALPVPSTGNATLYVDPSPVTLAVGSSQHLAIMLSPGSTPVNGVQLHLNVDPSYLRLVNVTKGTSQLDRVLEEVTFDVNTGVVRFGAGILGAVVSEPFVVVTLEVEAVRSTGQNGTPITFLQTDPATDIAGNSTTGSVMEAALDGIVIVEGVETTATLQGQLDLQGRPAKPHLSWSIPLTVELTLEETSLPTIYNVTTDEMGRFQLSNLPPGTYQIRVKGSHTLATQIKAAPLAAGTNQIFFGTLLEGDIEVVASANYVKLNDFGLLSSAFDHCSGESGYLPNADLNETDACVTIEDFGLLSANFNQSGDILYDSSALVPAPLPIASAGTTVAFATNRVVAAVGDVITLPLVLDSGSGDAFTGFKGRYRFDPATVEVLEVVVTGALNNSLQAPVIDNSAGTLNFSYAAANGQPLTGRHEAFLIKVKLKQSSPGSAFTPALGGPRDTNVAGRNGSVLAGASGVTIVSDEMDHGFSLYLPVITR